MFSNILLPIDLGRDTEAAGLFTAAVAIAKAHDAKLRVMTVVPDYGMAIVGTFFPADFEHKALALAEKELDRFVGSQQSKYKVHQQIVAHGSIYKEIVRVANTSGSDLIIMGVGESDSVGQYLAGHNATQVVSHATCSVMAIRGAASG